MFDINFMTLCGCVCILSHETRTFCSCSTFVSLRSGAAHIAHHFPPEFVSAYSRVDAILATRYVKYISRTWLLVPHLCRMRWLRQLRLQDPIKDTLRVAFRTFFKSSLVQQPEAADNHSRMRNKREKSICCISQLKWFTHSIEAQDVSTRRHTMAQEHKVCGLAGY